MIRLISYGILLCALLPGSVVQAQEATVPAGFVVDRVVMLMRHGVRPPTKAPAMPAGVANGSWPDWPVNPGWLTPHGAEAITRLGDWDGARFRRLGLLPAAGCPATDKVKVVADSDQRTIATADAWLQALAPGCTIASTHKPQGETDPIFSAIETGLGHFDPAAADAGVVQALGPGGIAALDQAQKPLLNRVDAILCGTATSGCGVQAIPSAITSASTGKRPKLTGALDRASTVAQILLLEYAEGKPMAEIGWGRATAQDVTALSVLHALEFRLLARPHAIAAANLAGIVPLVDSGLTGETLVTMVSGHDTNVANLGGLLNVHWQAPGFAADDPAPGGALVIERLRDSAGEYYVRVLYRAQTLDQIRTAAPLVSDPPYLAVLPVPGCHAHGIEGLCSLAAFRERLGQ